MNRKRPPLVSWLLLALAAVFIGLIILLIGWGGRIEATLVVLGVPVFLALDACHPRTLLLLALPIVLIAGALYARAGRRPKPDPRHHTAS